MFDEDEETHDVYDEELNEIKFLKSKPTCFVIVGPPGCGKSHIAKQLQQYWKCKITDPAEIILNEIKAETEIGVQMSGKLMRGESLSTNFVTELIHDTVCHSPEINHHGYVLDSLPNQSCSSMNLQDQIELIQKLKLNPDFIIHIKIPSGDLKARRRSIRWDPVGGNLYIERMWKDRPDVVESEDLLEVEEGYDSEEEHEESVTDVDPYEVDFPLLPKATRASLVKLPEFYESTSDKTVDEYFKLSNSLIESKLIGEHCKRHVILLDGNEAPSVLFQQVLNKLESFPISPAIPPHKLAEKEEDEEEDDELEVDDDEDHFVADGDYDEVMQSISSYQNPVPAHNWRHSKWSYYCPVALKQGNMIKGKKEFACAFLDKMYVMSSADAMSSFVKNPRPYLLPPCPQIPCKIAVVGQPFTGKTDLVHDLAKELGARVINMKCLSSDLRDAEKDRLIKLKMEETKREALRKLQNKSNDETLTESDTEVVSLAEEMARAQVTDKDVVLPPNELIAILRKAVKEVVDKKLKCDPEAPKTGGWILDNFALTKEQLVALQQEENAEDITPDHWIAMLDTSDDHDVIRKNFAKRNPITVKSYKDRIENEKLQQIEDLMRALNKIAGIASDASEKEEENEEKEKPKEPQSKPGSGKETRYGQESDKKENASQADLASLQQELREVRHYKGVFVPPMEMDEMRDLKSLVARYRPVWEALQPLLEGKLSILDVAKFPNSVLDRGKHLLKKLFMPRASEFDEEDQAEEDEMNDQMRAVMRDDVEEGRREKEEDDVAEEEEGDVNRKWGKVGKFDAVALKQHEVLVPGDEEIIAKYRDHLYSFHTPENRDLFIEEPLDYIDVSLPMRPPPFRLFLLGPRGSGKTVNGGELADKLGIFHISFRERLQEMIFHKVGRKLGPEYDEERLLAEEKKVSVDEAVRKGVASRQENNLIEGDQYEGNEEEESNEGPDLTEEEAAIQSYLLDDEVLPPEVLNLIIPKFFNSEPYKSTGFILEDFPRNADECEYLRDNGYFPDMCLSLEVDEEVISKRLLHPRMDCWKKRRAIVEKKRNEIRKKKNQSRKEAMEKRRKELIAEKVLENEENENNEEDSAADIEEEVDAQLEDEFPEDEEDEEDEESLDEAEERLKDEISEQYESDIANIDGVLDQLNEMKIPTSAISASRKLSVIQYLINKKVRPLTEHRASLFQRCYPIGYKNARKLIESGYKNLSAFAYWDPVKLYEHPETVTPPVRDKQHPLFACVYNQQVYFFQSPANRDAFMKDPVLYTRFRPPLKPVVPMCIVVTGPPKSGKTLKSARFASEFGLLHVSIGKALRKTINQQAHTILAQEIVKCLINGKTVPMNLCMESVINMMLDTRAQTQGYVLDGFPQNLEQVAILKDAGVIPSRIVHLQASLDECIKRAKLDVESRPEDSEPLHESEAIIRKRYAEYETTIGGLHENFSELYKNWLDIEKGLSKWKTWETANRKVMEDTKLLQDYTHNVDQGKAARLVDLCVTSEQFEAKLGEYGHYCPVALNDLNKLVDCTFNDFQFAVEFEDKYYKCASIKNVKKFLAHPAKYVPPSAKVTLPKVLPKRITREELKQMFPKQLEFNGYCPVTYVDGFNEYEAIEEGNENYAAEYEGNLYVFKDEQCLEKFLQQPHKYKNLNLPKKLPPKKLKLNHLELPKLGFLEQTLADVITKALNEVGILKPKLPFLSVKKSALFFMACYLKAYNKNSTSFSRQLFKDKLKSMQEECKLISYLGNNMSQKFIDPGRRPRGFDEKLELFMSFKDVDEIDLPIEI